MVTDSSLWQLLNPYLLSNVLLYCTSTDIENLSKVHGRAGRLYQTICQRTKQQQQQQQQQQGKNVPPPTLPVAPVVPNMIRLVVDPDTLLARLNTRRLYQRLRRCHKETSDDDEQRKRRRPYSLGKTTEQLALDEWREILQEAKGQNIHNNNNEEKEGQGPMEIDSFPEEDYRDVVVPRPSSLELLLFSPCPRAVTVLASYPRSGNSLMRNLFERVTLRVTGSDMRGGLTQHDLVGEAAVEARNVQFVKTHFPERRGFCVLPASRAVLLVRNPLDAINSYFHLLTTQSHTTSLTEQQQQAAALEFQTMARKEIIVWKRFHEYWLQVAKQTKIPVLLVRYEDLIRHPDQVLSRVVRFVLEIDDMHFFQKRIQSCCGVPVASTDTTNLNKGSIEDIGAYKPRAGGIGKSLTKYSDGLRRELLLKTPGIAPMMHQLGYAELLNMNSSPENWKLPHIPGFALAINCSTAKRRPQEELQSMAKKSGVIMINKGPNVRSPPLFTDWKAVRKIIYGDSVPTSALVEARRDIVLGQESET